MARYKLLADYRAGSVGPYEKGQVVDLEPELAAWINRDGGGKILILVEIQGISGEAKKNASPQRDRQVKKAETRAPSKISGVRGTDRGTQESIDKNVFKAVKG